ncbi:RsmD family RNA methyltransferase [Bacteroidota bacterium]
MRIIGGKYRGKQIIPDKKFKARPTTDFAKEGLFNILWNSVDFEQICVLDLFSGTGSISFEFSSLGSSEVTAVEINKRYAEYIEKTAEQLGFDQIIVINDDVLKFIPVCSLKYDIIFADPPYDLKGIETIPDLVLNQGILKNEESMFIMEHGPNLSFSHHSCFYKQKKYGKVHFSFFNQH